MSRPPPSGLSLSDQLALREMRKRMWIGGLKGMAAGFVTGKVGFWLTEKLHKFHSMKLNRNHRFATPLLTAAMGGLLMSLTAGKNETHTLHYILAKTSSPQLTEYQERVAVGRLEGEGNSWDELRVNKSEEEEEEELLRTLSSSSSHAPATWPSSSLSTGSSTPDWSR